MKRKLYSFILLEIVIGLFLFSFAATFLMEGIFRFTQKTNKEILGLEESFLADSLSITLLQEKIQDLDWDELSPFNIATWSNHLPKSDKSLPIKIKWGYLSRYDAHLTSNVDYRVLKLAIQLPENQKSFEYYYLLRKE